MNMAVFRVLYLTLDFHSHTEDSLMSVLVAISFSDCSFTTLSTLFWMSSAQDTVTTQKQLWPNFFFYVKDDEIFTTILAQNFFHVQILCQD